MPLAAEHRSSDGIPWPQIYGHYLEQCRTVHDAIRAKPQLRPTWSSPTAAAGAPTLFLREVLDCPIINLLRILLREQPSRHLLPDRPAAGRARPVLPALHQRADPGGAGRLRRRLLGDALAEAVVPARGSTPRSRSTSTGSTPRSTARARASADRRDGRSRRARESSPSSRAAWSRSGASTCS